MLDELRQRAIAFGFSNLSVVDIAPLLKSEERFLAWRKKGYAANMSYLLRTEPINARPEKLLENAKSLLIFSSNYHSKCPPKPGPEYGRVASYAVGLDYHKILKKKIQELINTDKLFKEITQKSKIFIDPNLILANTCVNKYKAA